MRTRLATPLLRCARASPTVTSLRIASAQHHHHHHHQTHGHLATPHRRAAAVSFSTTTARMASLSPKPRFSAGADEAALGTALEPLLASAGPGQGHGRWTLTASGEGLERSFKFKTFAKTWDFMTAVALQCKLKNHHPEWSNVYNTTHIRWTTHNPQGLSALDVELARICDGLARDFGEVVADGDGASSELKQVVDRATGAAGDCCGKGVK
ncbi:transcriptional coactivator/pterin dehydratase [Xylariaceae sp. FL0016]|nr:transcriptional coactivator/pterin dehydratase [Xylariaceae sp. FL0016]